MLIVVSVLPAPSAPHRIRRVAPSPHDVQVGRLLTLKRRKELLAIMCLPQSDPDRDTSLPYGAKPLLTFLREPSAVGCASAAKRKRVDTVSKEVLS